MNILYLNSAFVKFIFKSTQATLDIINRIELEKANLAEQLKESNKVQDLLKNKIDTIQHNIAQQGITTTTNRTRSGTGAYNNIVSISSIKCGSSAILNIRFFLIYTV